MGGVFWYGTQEVDSLNGSEVKTFTQTICEEEFSHVPNMCV